MQTPDDLPLAAHLAMTDYLYELRRQERGVKPVDAPKPSTNPFAVPTFEDTGIKTTPQASPKVRKLEYGEHEAPAIAYVRSLGIEAVVASQVAEEIGCSVQLVRKLRANPDFQAPSLEVPYGKNKIYLYTPEDVEELRTYVQRSRTPQPRSRS